MVAQSDPLSKLYKWLLTQNFDTKAHITTITPANRKLTAADDIPANSVVLRIPAPCAITSTQALSHAVVSAILREHPPPEPTTNESAGLLLYLLLQLCDHTYKVWFETLPSEIITATTARSIELLRGTPLHPLAQTLREELDYLYETWYRPITQITPHFPESITSKQSFLRAHAIIESRAFLLDEVTIIAPYADMCNHSPSPNTTVRPYHTPTSSTPGVELLSTRPISKNEEITISYGRLQNFQLLLHWGFALLDNIHEEVLVTLEQPEQVERVLIMAVVVNCDEFALKERDPLPAELVKAARVMALADGELEGGARRDYSCPVSEESENRAVSVLRGIVEGLRVSPAGYQVKGDDGEDGDVFNTFCDVYKKSIERILDLVDEKIDDMARAIAR